MKVYGHPASTYYRKVATVLAEKGHEADFQLVDLMKGEQKRPEYLAMQPFGVVPVLDDNGFVLYESQAIVRYLDQTLPGPSLTPSDAKARAVMEQFISVEQGYFTPGAQKVFLQVLFMPMMGKETDQAIVEQGKGECSRALDVLARHLEKNEYLAPTGFSLADITYMPNIEYLFAAKAGDLITSRAPVSAWWERISARPSWKKAAGR